MGTLVDKVISKVKSKVDENCENGKIETSERILSVVAGGFIVGAGVRFLIKHPLTALSGLSLGGALVYRGVTGKCAVKKAIEDDAERVEVIEHRYFIKKD
ncbi:YgaP family membrane protein [Sphingobacterium faecium]